MCPTKACQRAARLSFVLSLLPPTLFCPSYLVPMFPLMLSRTTVTPGTCETAAVQRVNRSSFSVEIARPLSAHRRLPTLVWTSFPAKAPPISSRRRIASRRDAVVASNHGNFKIENDSLPHLARVPSVLNLFASTSRYSIYPRGIEA